ncbi:hypothetical protein BLA39750_03450 [Burkholderia lata]|uniref:DUF3022 domain-containing protein n=1 Tax=Burkholderia lata (strain ATCC 17760 / DSM 23089 / LMG 22485 / NCIMB 9086 / R18194 / 383) TaxID=482957 RepID=A0A6P2XWL1_BURL3|nr:DUF3022 domain-containing protein [Burkholderia lata]VWD14372.1 hypothetical protein BLA39750_03450 [Burkholderia lata]
MSRASGRSQCVAELERALANGFPSGSTVVVQADDASGRLAIQVEWVREPTEENAREWRCAVDLRFDADAIGRYASLDAADRLRVRTHLCDLARRAVDERKPHVEDAAIECHVALEVTRAGLDAALRAP